MNNTTTFVSAEPLYDSWQWIFHQTYTCVLLVIEVYMLVCLLLFEFGKTPKKVRASTNNASFSDSTTIRQKARVKTGRAKRERRKYWLSRLTIFSCGCAVFLTLTNEIDLFLGSVSQPACMAYGIMLMCGYGGNLVANMLILWLRQDAVQDNKALASLPGRKLRMRLSKVLLGAMATTFLIIWCLSVIGPYLEPSPRGCLFADQGTISQSTRALSGLIFTVLFQPALVAMLLYPFLKRLPKTDNRMMRAGKQIHLVMKRTLISLTIIIITDVGAIVASFLLEREVVIWVATVYDINVFVGASCVIYAYHDWRRRLRLTCIPSTSSVAMSLSTMNTSVA